MTPDRAARYDRYIMIELSPAARSLLDRALGEGVALEVDSEPAADIRTAIDSLAARSSDPHEYRPVPEEIGRILFALSKLRRTRTAVVAGAAPGASSLWLAAGLRKPGGRLIAIERDSGRRTALQATLRKVDAPIEIELGDVANVLPRLTGRFDIVFADTTPADRAAHVDMLIARCRPGALVISRTPAEPSGATSLAATNAVLRTHPSIVATASLGLLTLALVDGGSASVVPDLDLQPQNHPAAQAAG